ncbi:MAG TPA: glycosyltransferase family 4 protein [Candidatus Sulfopaludibacter sp.]|nr:glycosyltransferase family 4 protein [Candidatus Sulfopaludibacter sp.]
MASEYQARPSVLSLATPQVALLTGGGDKPYALGLATALTSAGLPVDFIGSTDLCCEEILNNPRINFLNLRGDQNASAGWWRKVLRVLVYYVRLLVYAATARPRVFHILWNNKFEIIDRTALMLYYRLLGKKVVLTAHNINAGQRDGKDSLLNRMTLGFQYRMCDRIFVHTHRMKQEAIAEFGVAGDKVDVIPFGINRTVPDTPLTTFEARQRLGLAPDGRVVLFFGNIAPYKGLEFLVEAFELVGQTDLKLHLVVAGRLKDSEPYWRGLLEKINHSPTRKRMVLKIEYVPDAETEIYFKAADVLVLPYTHVYQSGVLSLGYGFGLPVIAADVGSLREEIIEGRTGFVFGAKDSRALAGAIKNYFDSDLYRDLKQRRPEIRDYANDHYSWAKVAAITSRVYSNLVVN